MSRLTHPEHRAGVRGRRCTSGSPTWCSSRSAADAGRSAAAQRRRARREAVALMLGVLDALRGRTRAGIVHRDLKPSNILLGPRGRARVMDFGIAARVHRRRNVGQIVGTPGYMSPEAARGKAPTAGDGRVRGRHDAGRDALRPPLIASATRIARCDRAQHEDLTLARGARPRSTTACARSCCGARGARSGAALRRARRPCATRCGVARRRRQRSPAAGGGARHAGLPAAPHAPQERLPGAVGCGRAHPARRRSRRTRAWPAWRARS